MLRLAATMRKREDETYLRMTCTTPKVSLDSGMVRRPAVYDSQNGSQARASQSPYRRFSSRLQATLTQPGRLNRRRRKRGVAGILESHGDYLDVLDACEASRWKMFI